MKIPKKLAHIWIGPYSAPLKWMQTWRDKHPDWEYTLYDNNYLKNNHFKNQPLINEYLKRGQYAGVSDLMRLEILHKHGGFIAEADSICYNNIEEILTEEKAYTVYENELTRGRLVSPILASEPQNDFIGKLINALEKIKPEDLDEPWISTGNLFLAQMIDQLQPDITIFPSHFFIPVHFTGVKYQGNDKIYAKQLFGSTTNKYETPKMSILEKILFQYNEKSRQKYSRKVMREIRKRKKQLFNLDKFHH